MTRRPGCRHAPFAAQRVWGHGLALALMAVVIALCMVWIDQPLAWAFRHHRFFFDGFAALITHIGDSRWALSASLSGWVLGRMAQRGFPGRGMRERARWLSLASGFVFVSVASSGLLVNLLKYLFGRARFNALMLRGEYGFYFFEAGYDFSSFPSGHANTAIALAIALSCLWPRARRLFLLAGVLLALSRVVVTAHYLSDALVGGLLGWWTTRLWWRWFIQRYPILGSVEPAGRAEAAGQCVDGDAGGTVSSVRSWPTSTASKPYSRPQNSQVTETLPCSRRMS